MKVCSRCREEKELSEFNKNIKMTDGKQTACRKCQAIQAKEYVANPEKLKRKKQATEKFLKKHPTYRSDYHFKIYADPELKAKYKAKYAGASTKRYQQVKKFEEDYTNYHKDYYLKNIDKLNETTKKWYEANRERQIAYYKAYKIKNKEMNFAHEYIKNQMRNGLLLHPSHCSSCGSDQYVHWHHHNGYSKEHVGDVIALCRHCIKTKFGKKKRLTIE